MITKDRLILGKLNSEFRSVFSQIMGEISTESHPELQDLFIAFSANDLNRFVYCWKEIPVRMRTPLIAYIVSGGEPDTEFLKFLDSNELGQEAIDLAFRVQVDSLHNLGKSIKRADDALSAKQNQEQSLPILVRLLLETEKAEDVLEMVKMKFEKMITSDENRDKIIAIISSLQNASSAIEVAQPKIKELVG